MRIRIAAAVAAVLILGLIPLDARAEQVSVGGSFLVSDPVGGGCEFSPECFTRTHLCGAMQQVGDPEIRDGVTVSFRRVPTDLLGRKALFSYEATMLTLDAFPIIEFRTATCVDTVLILEHFTGPRTITVPSRARWIAVLGYQVANLNWSLAGPLD